MEIPEGNVALAALPADVDGRLQGREGDAHVGRVQRDALLAPAEDGVHPRPTLDCVTAGAGAALVAPGREVPVVRAAGPLHQVARHAGDVAELRRRAGEQ